MPVSAVGLRTKNLLSRIIVHLLTMSPNRSSLLRMRNAYVFVLTCVLACGSTAANGVAITKAPFKNCKEVNAKYPGGIAKSAKSKNKGGATKKSPKVDSKLYLKIDGLDRDKDGIACEK